MPLIDIPGYKILRQLGRGGMATVYLAVQESVQREVALKVMSPALLADPDFSERFLREARIAAKLHHRHVVGIHDVARSGDYNYIAMEYLGGGPVLPHDGSARSLAFALRVTREIALALDYAHAKGFVHRDVKPDNILLRDDGSAALTDFGIARAADSATRMTRTGAVIGTPHYMSPEQARGKTVDGRADLYSLGVVLYEMLVGRVPYHAEDSLAVGIMHITEPVPVLPERFVALQPVLARMLAKQPDDRYQNGRQLAEAIEHLERAIVAGEHPELAADDGADETHAAHIDDIRLKAREDDASDRAPFRPTTPVVALHHRVDPALGRLDDLGETGSYRAIGRGSARRGGKRSVKPRRGWITPVAVACAIALIAGAAWQWQDRLRALVPNTPVNDTLAHAQRSLAANHLLGAGGARELFESVRAQDPDNDQAREGLNQVGQHLLADARTALQKRDFAAARENLDAANDVLGGGTQVEELKAAFDAAQAKGTQVENLLARADAALAANRLLGADGAATLYRQILDADANNAVARHGLDKVAAAQAQLVREALAQGDAELASQRIAQLAELAPNHAAIPELRSALAKRREADAQQQAQAQTQQQEQAAQQAEPQKPVAQKPARQKPQPPSRQQAAQMARVERGRVRQREAAREEEEATQQSMREPSLADRARVEDLLAEADRALAAGDLMDPGGAYDKYRAALAIDGNNTRAMEGLKRIAPRARTLFDQAIAAGRPNNARSYLDAIADTDPGNPALIGLRARLGEIYYDQADRFVGEGRRNDALRALNAARQLSPISPRSAALEAKIESMPAGG